MGSIHHHHQNYREQEKEKEDVEQGIKSRYVSFEGFLKVCMVYGEDSGPVRFWNYAIIIPGTDSVIRI